MALLTSELAHVFDLEFKEDPETLEVKATGALTVTVPNSAWAPLSEALKKSTAKKILLDLSALSSLDLGGSAQIISLQNAASLKGLKLEVINLKPEVATIWALAQSALKHPMAPVPRRNSLVETLGEAALYLKNDLKNLLVFLGELLSDSLYFLFHPHCVRWKTVFHVAEKSGVNALPIVCLVSFLVGLILAFQAAIPMKIFGAEIYVADLIGISVVRELGPLITAIVLAGRSGSAFSAEIGAMKAGQEIDAIVTMGLSPVRDLVFPRVLATVITTPLVTVISSFMGLLGGNVVLFSLGYTAQVYWGEVVGIVDLSDYLTGLFKCFVFGFTVAMIGCQRGLEAQEGPGAVGEATTRGVVSNIIAIVLFDSLFAVVFYVLGI